MKEMKSLRPILLPGLIVLSLAASQCKPESGKDLSKEQERWVEKTLRSMSVEQKVGQLLAPTIGISGWDKDSSALNQVTEWIRKYRIGNLYVGGHGFNPLTTAEFINAIQGKTDIPLLIHSDLETGTGAKFDGGTILPPLMGLAQTRSEDLVYQAASITAKESRAMGIHLINSPVLDVNINPANPVICTRSFGEDAGLVSRLGMAFVRGLNDNGLIGAAKHFPGHGDVSIDSHSETPTILASRERLDSVEFLPYREIVPGGLKAVMTAHISVPALDPTPGLPATMSQLIMTGILRQEMGFGGLIITDAFDMGGILNTGSFEESAVQSVIAGNDVVLLWTKPRFELVCPHMLKAIEEGRITVSHLDESVRRVLTAKAQLGLHKERFVDTEAVRVIVGAPVHCETAREIYERSVVLVRNEDDLLPLKSGTGNIAVFSVNDDENHPGIGAPFVGEVDKRGNVVSEFFIDPNTAPEDLKQAFNMSREADVVVIGLFARVFARRGSSSLIHPQLIQLLEDLSRESTPVFVVSFGSPYLLTNFPEVDGYMIATEPSWDFYGYDKFRPGQIAAAKAIFGEIEISGKLAVSIPGLYPFGHGINVDPAAR